MYKYLMILIVSLFAVACGDEHAHEDGETPQEEGCEHMQAGPAEAVTAAADQASAPDATFEHTRVDLTLLDDGTGVFNGYANYESTEAGEYFLFSKNDAPFQILDSSGTEVPIESTNADFAECTDVAVEYLFDLEVGTYTFVFGPTSEGAASYVVEHAGEHAEE